MRELTIIADISSPRTRAAVLAEISRQGLTADMFEDRAIGDTFAQVLEDADSAFGVTDSSLDGLSEGDRKSIARLVRPNSVQADVSAVVQDSRKRKLKAELVAAAESAWENTDAASFMAEVADSVRKIQREVDGRDHGQNESAHPRGTVAEIRARTKDRVDYSNEIFRDLWLERGGGAFWISSSGTGKSVHSIQASYAWALGRDYFGIMPRAALRIAIVQAEDSTNECTVTFNGVRAGYKSQNGGGWTDADIEAAESRISFWGDLVGKRGDVFCQALRNRLMDAKLNGQPIDLLIINPFTSFIDGDINKSDEVVDFLQNNLDPVLKSKDCGCGCLLFHHTNKPPSADKGTRGGWASIAEKAEYAGSGSSALTNWARATLLFLRNDKCNGDVFDFIANKRGGLLGWKRADGRPTQYLRIRHTRFGEIVPNERTPFWQIATDEDVTRSQGEKKERTDHAQAQLQERAAAERQSQQLADMAKMEAVAEEIRTSGQLYAAGSVRRRIAVALAQSEFSVRTKAMFLTLRESPLKYGLMRWKRGLTDLYGSKAAIEAEQKKYGA